MVAYYPFDGDFKNAAENSGHGQNVGTVFTKDRFGIDNKAIQLNNEEGYILIDDRELNLPLGDSPRTVSVWVKTASHIAQDPIINYGKGGEVDKVFLLSIVDGFPRMDFGWDGIGRSFVSDGNWHHIVGTFDGKTAAIYVDSRWDCEFMPGEGIMKVNITLSLEHRLTIGKENTLLWKSFSGAIDEVRIYDRVLTEEEIMELYDCSTMPAEKQPDAFDAFQIKLSSNINNDMQKILNDIIADKITYGLSAASISKDFNWLGASGMSNPRNNTKMTTGMLFRIGDAGHTYIAVLANELIEEGKLSLDDSIHKWLPAYPNIDSSITIRQLLDQSSGVYNFFMDDDWHGEVLLYNPDKVFAPDETLRQFVKEPYNTPGTTIHGSITNYIILGMIIKDILQDAVSKELRSRYFDPLGLKNTFFSIEETIEGPIAKEWRLLGDYGMVNITDFVSCIAINSTLWTGGAIYSTGEDLAKWEYNLFSGKVISDSILSKMSEPNPYDGLGIRRFLMFKRELLGGGGMAPLGYRNWFVFSAKDSVCVVLLANAFPQHTGSALEKLLLTYLIHQNNYPLPRLLPSDIDVDIDTTVIQSKIDTSFYVYNYGVGIDSITTVIDFGGIAAENLQVEPQSFILAPGDSQKITISITINNSDDFLKFRPKVQIISKNELVLPGKLTARLYFNKKTLPTTIQTHDFETLVDLQCIPNPCNSITTFKYKLLQNGLVSFKIYNLTGQEIETLVNDYQTAGIHEIKWNADVFPGGIYFLKLIANNYQETRKLIVE